MLGANSLLCLKLSPGVKLAQRDAGMCGGFLPLTLGSWSSAFSLPPPAP